MKTSTTMTTSDEFGRAHARWFRSRLALSVLVMADADAETIAEQVAERDEAKAAMDAAKSASDQAYFEGLADRFLKDTITPPDPEGADEHDVGGGT